MKYYEIFPFTYGSKVMLSLEVIFLMSLIFLKGSLWFYLYIFYSPLCIMTRETSTVRRGPSYFHHFSNFHCSPSPSPSAFDLSLPVSSPLAETHDSLGSHHEEEVWGCVIMKEEIMSAQNLDTMNAQIPPLV
jgi:hypothetical protein